MARLARTTSYQLFPPGDTTARFPDIDWFRGYARALKRNEDFKQNCRWVKGGIAFRVDGQAATVSFDDGRVTGVQKGMFEPDYVISGPASA